MSETLDVSDESKLIAEPRADLDVLAGVPSSERIDANDYAAFWRLLVTFDDQVVRRVIAATAWNNRPTEGQIKRQRTNTPDVWQGQIGPA